MNHPGFTLLVSPTLKKVSPTLKKKKKLKLNCLVTIHYLIHYRCVVFSREALELGFNFVI